MPYNVAGAKPTSGMKSDLGKGRSLGAHMSSLTSPSPSMSGYKAGKDIKAGRVTTKKKTKLKKDQSRLR